MPEISTAVSSRVFYTKTGTGPAIVLLHGFPESGTLWDNVLGELSARYTVIVPDFPGSGSSVLQQETSIADMAGCVKSILDHEHIGRAVMAGHSMGGYVAFALAGLYPDRVAGLSLVHSTPAADDEERVKIRLKAIEVIRKGGRDAFINQMVSNLFAGGFVKAQMPVVQRQVDEALKVEAEGLINYYKAMIARTDHGFVLDGASFPVQWVIGVEDNVMYFKNILKHCHRSDINFVTLYQDCGHMSMIEAPERLNNDFKEFFNYCYCPNE